MSSEKKLRAKPIIKQVYANLQHTIEKKQLKPCLVIIILGNDPAAVYYMNNLRKKGAKIGIEVKIEKLDTSISQEALISKIDQFNSNSEIHGIMLQKPLPKHIDEVEIVMKIAPDKDVDGFHPLNMGKLVLNQDSLLPSTPAAVLKILDFYNIKTEGKNVVILGRSAIVGKPLANLLLRKDSPGNATVTVCHSRTQHLANITSQADILVAAIGKANFVKKEMIKQEAIIIDVGVNQIEDAETGYKYLGDVDYNDCFEKAAKITPVPGGVGSVTTSMLLSNVVKAALK
ncbi:MAG: methylenetetrahydrofolate dehydrogenase / methenyltetrahydrofolate cyclohydrolase [Candidatus Cloacimonadota bacterium]|jgi:methylenetetrahydrofolate dehydrogenase (NADP+)/methenyltetrahydrofolate cyclohydrolase|nr:methylenetetrahydrofolate dehydrogenase / methenyltetrahydrofolate cyclohydrolase [Candidatus Cloacimonadota bacterium]